MIETKQQSSTVTMKYFCDNGHSGLILWLEGNPAARGGRKLGWYMGAQTCQPASQPARSGYKSAVGLPGGAVEKPISETTMNLTLELLTCTAHGRVEMEFGGCHAAPAGETLFVWSVLDRGFWLAGIVSFPIVVSHEKEQSNWLKRPKLCNVDAITGVPPTDDNPIRTGN
ncbi:hypothetical protein WN51_02980 [Melipona quadrifasciata]|uniref:Uncharacterized protein n=1 Tax=Melipona quadrifasciata TaxID=166423 RepID=A0A0M8ZV94_9HYME|nr:hypothetical protein WN51_02980 [Melipona quadrifasciata]